MLKDDNVLMKASITFDCSCHCAINRLAFKQIWLNTSGVNTVWCYKCIWRIEPAYPLLNPGKLTRLGFISNFPKSHFVEPFPKRNTKGFVWPHILIRTVISFRCCQFDRSNCYLYLHCQTIMKKSFVWEKYLQNWMYNMWQCIHVSMQNACFDRIDFTEKLKV